MLLLRKILTKPIPLSLLVSSLLVKKQVNYFSNAPSNRKSLKQIHSKVVTDHRKIKPDALIKMLHHTHFRSQETQEQSIFTAAQINQIVDNLKSVSFQLTHEDMTLLLETISQFKQFEYYNRNNQLMRLLVKRFSTMQLMALDHRYIFRFINVLEKMRFPTLIISKYVNIFVNKYQDKMSKQQPILNSDNLKFFICILQMKFIPIDYVAKLYNDRIKNLKIVFPKDLCYLYYIYRTLQKSLQAKISYFSNKIRVHQLVFNPYSQMTETSNQIKNDSNNESVQQKQKKLKQLSQIQKQRNIKNSENLIAQMKKNINVQKLRQQICKYYDFQKYPMQISTALLVKDIKQLQPTIQQLLKKHYKQMQVIQFISLLPSVPQQQRAFYYKQYTKIVWNSIQLNNKLKLLKANSQLCNNSITKQKLLQIISQSHTISSQQFQYITSLIIQYIKSEDQLQILKAIQLLADKNNDNL